MSERYVTLLGAEQVQSAANTMSNAAGEMKRAASEMSYAFESHQRFLTGWLADLQTVLEAKTNKMSHISLCDLSKV